MANNQRANTIIMTTVPVHVKPKSKYDPPTPTFPYKIRRRLNMLSVPKRTRSETSEDLPKFTKNGVRISALRGQVSDRVNDASWPYMRRILALKRQYKNVFSPERLEKINHMLEAANATCYAKLANCTIDLKGREKDVKKKRGWSESEWKKHMDYIGQIAGPKPAHEPEPVDRGPQVPLEELLPRIDKLCWLPEFKFYRRLSQEPWYKNMGKPTPNALKYNITPNILKLAQPKVLHHAA